MLNVIRTRKLGFNRKNKRLWLTPKLVSEAGLAANDTIYISYSESESDSSPVLTISSIPIENALVGMVANTSKGGVIDINNKDITHHFQDYQKVNITLTENGFTVTGETSESKIKEREASFIRRAKTGEPMRKGGLFTGLGLLCESVHEGLADTGIKVKERFGNEIDELAADVSVSSNSIWKDPYPDATFYQGDIHHMNMSLIPKLDILVIGLPCPASSNVNTTLRKAGKTDVFHPQTGTVFHPTLKAIEESNPALVVLENVVGFKGSVIDHIMSDVMDRHGYIATDMYITGHQFGDFEMRRRLCRVWYSKGLPEFNFSGLESFAKANERTVSDVLEPIDLDDRRWGRREYLEKKQAEKHNNHGYNLVNGETKIINTMGANYGKIQPDSPMVPHPNKPKYTRTFTQAEHCNIREIKDVMRSCLLSIAHGTSDLTISNNTKGVEVHKMLGNSCSPRAWRAIGSTIGFWIKMIGSQLKINEEDAPSKPSRVQLELI